MVILTISICQIFTNQLCTVPLHLKQNLKICALIFEKLNITEGEFRTFIKKILLYLKRIEVFKIIKKWNICFNRCRTKSSKLRNSSRHQVMPSSKKPKNYPKNKKIATTKNYIQDFWNAPSVMFLD